MKIVAKKDINVLKTRREILTVINLQLTSISLSITEFIGKNLACHEAHMIEAVGEIPRLKIEHAKKQEQHNSLCTFRPFDK